MVMLESGNVDGGPWSLLRCQAVERRPKCCVSLFQQGDDGRHVGVQ